MGYAKNHAMEIEERGFDDSDLVICSDCINNIYLKKYCEQNTHNDTCSYCDLESASCIYVEELMIPIMESVYRFYESSEQYYINDDEIDGYLITVFDKDELILDELADDLEFSEEILNDISQLINIDSWCERDPYGDSESTVMKSLWNSFVHMVTEESRYVFFKRSTERQFNSYDMEPYEILEYIGKIINDLNLYVDIPVTRPIYRARMHARAQIDDICNDKELGSPPASIAKANRMSAEGISIFYGASDSITALNEVYSSTEEMATVGVFYASRPLHCVDLSTINEVPVPNIFDKDNWVYREAIRFLKSLHKDLTRNISNMKAIEYVPVQIIAEYFRYIYECKSGDIIDGICYSSSQNPKTGKCYALFFNSEKCRKWFGDQENIIDEWVLRLDENQIQRFDAQPPYPVWVNT